MANFFDIERHQCKKCDGEVFELVNTFLLNKTEDGKLQPEPYRKGYRCIRCHELVMDYERTILREE